MGVHISFVRYAANSIFIYEFEKLIRASMERSTNLDSWQLNQLRNMKVGGNAFATEFFTKHGGSNLLSDSDTKKKYSSRIAELYKEELAKRVKEDIAKFVSHPFHIPSRTFLSHTNSNSNYTVPFTFIGSQTGSL